MKKLADLRQYLTENVPSLAKDPDRLQVFIEKGSLACSYGSLSFQYAYEACVLVTDFTDHADTLIVPLLAWIATNQPDLMLDVDKRGSVVRFEAEIVDHDKTDVLLRIDLTERVVVGAVDGHTTATHCDEPPLPDLGGPVGWTLYGGAVEVVP